MPQAPRTTSPPGPFYPFLASLVFNTPILTIIIMGSFLFWSLPSMIANTFMPIRSFFAWSFDRLMPESLANVNERTHSPINAILVTNVIIAALVVWSVIGNQFQLVLGLIVLAGSLAVIIVGIAALALPIRRPDLYQASPANVKFLGVPVLYIVGTLSILEFIGIIAISFINPLSVMNGNRADWWWIPAWLGAPDRRRRAPLLRAEVHPRTAGREHRVRLQGTPAGVTDSAPWLEGRPVIPPAALTMS